jgi:hypothetical protein
MLPSIGEDSIFIPVPLACCTNHTTIDPEIFGNMPSMARPRQSSGFARFFDFAYQ